MAVCGGGKTKYFGGGKVKHLVEEETPTREVYEEKVDTGTGETTIKVTVDDQEPAALLREDLKEVHNQFEDKDATLKHVEVNKLRFKYDGCLEEIDVKLMYEGRKGAVTHAVTDDGSAPLEGDIKCMTFHDKNNKHLHHLDVAIPPVFRKDDIVVRVDKDPKTGHMMVHLETIDGDPVMDLDADKFTHPKRRAPKKEEAKKKEEVKKKDKVKKKEEVAAAEAAVGSLAAEVAVASVAGGLFS